MSKNLNFDLGIFQNYTYDIITVYIMIIMLMPPRLFFDRVHRRVDNFYLFPFFYYCQHDDGSSSNNLTIYFPCAVAFEQTERTRRP